MMKASRWSVVRGSLGWLVALTIIDSAVGQEVQEDNYFLPPDYQQAAAPPEPVKVSPLEKLELRSVSIMGDLQLFSIFDTSSSKGVWIELNGTVQGITVSDYDKSDGSVLVKSGGFTRRLKLKEAKIIALAVPAPSAPMSAPVATAAAGTPNMTTGTAGPVGSAEANAPSPAINNLSDDEVRARMQRVAEEIRRRRAMRREMAEQATQSQQ